MKAYMLMTKSGPIVVLTSHTSILDTLLLEKLADKDIENFIAFPLDLAEQRYGAQTSARIGFAAIHGLVRGVRPEFRDVASRRRVRRDIQ